MTIAELQCLKESEDKVEFKAATHNFSYAGSEHRDQEERRRCFLGYVIGFANEAGGMLVLGMADKAPHDVVGSDFAQGKVGALEDETYSRLGIRVRMEELYENGLRVLIAHIPSRPVGKMMKFEGVPLMRVGESLRNMSDEEMFAILSEQEPDFSAKICEGISIADLDEAAIKKMKESYARKQKNPGFMQLST
jgi:ATP-dependent DNA helicase RecG